MLKRFISEYRASILLFVVLTGLFGSVAFETYRSKVETNSKKEAAQQGIKIDESAPIKETEPIEVQPEAPAAPAPNNTTKSTTFKPSAPNNTTPTNTPKPYVASVCTRTVIPKTSERKPAEWLPTDTIKADYSRDGYRDVCTADSYGYGAFDNTTAPINEIIYVSTKPNNTEISACIARLAAINSGNPDVKYTANYEIQCSHPSTQYMN